MPYPLNHPPLMTEQQQAMLDKMNEQQREKDKGWEKRIVKKFPNITKIDYYVFLGAFCWTCPELKVKWLARGYTKNWGGGEVTPATVARSYLSIKYKRRNRRITNEQYDEIAPEQRQPPLVCKPGLYKDMVYFDLTAAYWSIVRSVGWDVDYMPGVWLSQRSEMFDFPLPFEKMTRNCLVSVGIPGTLSVWQCDRMAYLKTSQQFTNLVLYRLVMDVLNGVAYEMRKLGAKYIYIDGYIIDRGKADQVEEIMQSWGLRYGVRAFGDVDIKAPGAYSFADYTTEPYNPNMRRSRIDKVYNPNNRFLRSIFRSFSESAASIWRIIDTKNW